MTMPELKQICTQTAQQVENACNRIKGMMNEVERNPETALQPGSALMNTIKGVSDGVAKLKGLLERDKNATNDHEVVVTLGRLEKSSKRLEEYLLNCVQRAKHAPENLQSSLKNSCQQLKSSLGSLQQKITGKERDKKAGRGRGG